MRQFHRADGPAPVRAALQPGREPDNDIKIPLDHAAHVRPAHLDDHLVPGGERRGVHLGDGGRGYRLAVEGGEHVVHPAAQFVPEHARHLRPGHSGGIILETAQLGDELGRQQVTPGGQHLAQLDERDPAVLQGQPERPGQAGAPLGGGQLRPAAAAQVGQQPVPDQDAADLRIAAGPARLPAQAAQHVQRAGQRTAGHQGLGDDQENHADQQRDDHAEDHEPQLRQNALVTGDRGAADGRDDRRGGKEGDEAGQQRPERRQRQAYEPPHAEREHGHREGGGQRDEGKVEGSHIWSTAAPWTRSASRSVRAWSARSVSSSGPDDIGPGLATTHARMCLTLRPRRPPGTGDTSAGTGDTRAETNRQ